MKIYTLNDSTGIRYVGVTSRTLTGRYHQHIYAAKTTNGRHVCYWIRSLLDKGEKPVMTLLEECNDAIWEEREKYWIAKFLEEGCCLTNISPGGKGMCKDRTLTSIQRSSRAKHKPVYNTDLLGNRIREFASIKEACSHTSISKSSLNNALNYRRTAGGYYWFYLNQSIVFPIRKSRLKRIEISKLDKSIQLVGVVEAAKYLGCCRNRLSKILNSTQQYGDFAVKFID